MKGVTIASLFAIVALASALPAQTFNEYAVPTPDSQMLGITAGPDGNIWFTEQLGKKIGRITPAGIITEFTIPGTLVGPKQITAGPDGNVWFSDFISVGRVTPDGFITRFQIPSSSLPEGITSGPDGNIWVTMSSSAFQIARVTPNGAITEFQVPGITQLQAITSGPDGNLWFTDPNGKHIGRITTAGASTLFNVPQEVTGPYEIVTGPDGNLWFTSAFHIGRMTTAGVFTLFPDPGGDAPRGITTGPDGNVWYTESVGNNIGRIGMDGHMAEFRPPTVLAGPLDIAAGSDGAMWFIEYSKNKIGRVTTGPCTPGATSICANDSRFKVDVSWRVPSQGTSGIGFPVRLTADTVSFWFFTASNVELVVKVVDGRAVNARYWVFYGALSDVEYTITVTDAVSGAVKTYSNPQGQLASVADTAAFGPFP
jgi:virginiamycin B lyase